MKNAEAPSMTKRANPVADSEESTLIGVTTSLPPDVWAKANEEADREDRTMAAQIRRIVVAHYRRA